MSFRTTTPPTERTKEVPVWVHFGIGNIFRIFLGGIADRLISDGALDKGITCVEAFDFDVVDKIYAPFDNLVLAGQLRPILSNASIFGSGLYTAGIGEKIEDMVRQELAGPGAVRAALIRWLHPEKQTL